MGEWGSLKMRVIAHRGNTTGPNSGFENDPEQVTKALEAGYDVEVDVWAIDGEYWLGHDEPIFLVEERFLQNEKLWCHAKNIEALELMASSHNIHYFWHQEDDYTLTSRGIIWAHPEKNLTSKSVCVMPEWTDHPADEVLGCAGVCTDYAEKYMNLKREAAR